MALSPLKMDYTNTSVPSKVIGTKFEIHYIDRYAVRIILRNGKNETVLIHVEKGSYYKLPGGGIEADESHNVAAQREALEETGCKVVVHDKCMAVVQEWRHDLHQVSFCYLADLVEDTGKPQLTEDEKIDGLQHEWLSIEAALAKTRASRPTSELGNFIKERDAFFLKVYAKGEASDDDTVS